MRLGVVINEVDDIERIGRLGFEVAELRAESLGDAIAGPLDGESIQRVRELRRRFGVDVTALTYYDLVFRPHAPHQIEPTFEHVFDAAEALGAHVVACMAGLDATRSWNDNIQLFADRFGPVAALAERRGIRVAFENWWGIRGPAPFLPLNLGGTPSTWDAMFAAVPSKALGIEFDPSHLYWQGIDHLRALRDYRERIYYVHAKDVELLPEGRYRGGIYGRSYRFRLPGYGAIDWPRFISTLDEIGYTKDVAIEHEDKVYWGDRYDEGLIRGRQVLFPLIHPSGA